MPGLPLELAALFPVVAAAFAVEAALGFGGTVITVAVGSLWLPIPAVLPVLVPLGTALSAVLVARNVAHVAWRPLALRVLPWVAAGVPVGLYALTRVDAGWLKRGFGVFVLGLALTELRRAHSGAAAPLGGPARATLLALGGVVHGAFSTGGPMLVYVLGRELPDKARLRASLSVLWLPLNAALLVTYATQGRFTATTGVASAALVPAWAIGLVAGEWAHRRVSRERFAFAVLVVLAAVGAIVAARG
ncbi:MAG: sulfite exporter TauE/SafE family protein [Polyangiaceae bacterium]|nr:sulfite exporter TauE/SafE family protein [Polyangiaceae bacterium]